MMDFSFAVLVTDSSFVALLMKVIVLSVGFYLAIKQLNETRRPKDWLTRLRFYILGVLSLLTVIVIPSIVYQIIRIQGMDSDLLRSVSTITINFALVLIMLLLVLIFNYKRRE